MKNLLLLAGTALLLAGCASSEPLSANEASDRAACRRTDAPSGSNLVRRADCAPQRDAAAPAPTQKN